MDFSGRVPLVGSPLICFDWVHVMESQKGPKRHCWALCEPRKGMDNQEKPEEAPAQVPADGMTALVRWCYKLIPTCELLIQASCYQKLAVHYLTLQHRPSRRKLSQSWQPPGQVILHNQTGESMPARTLHQPLQKRTLNQRPEAGPLSCAPCGQATSC